MKRLYKRSATKDGIPKPSRGHRYNTARLFSPRSESHIPSDTGHAYSLDLFFNLDHVAVLEQLLRSVLLYSIDRVAPLPSFCSFQLLVREEEDSGNLMCFNTPHSFEFDLEFKNNSRHRWIEVDVTSFLYPLISFHKKNIHMTVNIACRKEKMQEKSFEEPDALLLMTPSLLLYLNDSSEQANQNWNTFVHQSREWYGGSSILLGQNESTGEQTQRKQKSTRVRRSQSNSAEQKNRNPPSSSTLNFIEHYEKMEFPTNECDLHDFRLKFSQLNWHHWIIAPHRYNPHYCKGECPRAAGHRYGSPVHTMVQNLLYETLDDSIPRPSCVPSEYSPLSVLTIETDGSIAYKEYQNMIAIKCTCR
ncbi:growth/differentiation factor 9 [Protopterus annectens]|uniref:growth/differentiation factor 9 n=1 Tax=Protopterus annectens TaxID=7888 RepID=UPI001CFC00F4|nr:growth/differentiation factor 9 [Protopterus annectens]